MSGRVDMDLHRKRVVLTSRRSLKRLDAGVVRNGAAFHDAAVDRLFHSLAGDESVDSGHCRAVRGRLGSPLLHHPFGPVDRQSGGADDQREGRGHDQRDIAPLVGQEPLERQKAAPPQRIL